MALALFVYSSSAGRRSTAESTTLPIGVLLSGTSLHNAAIVEKAQQMTQSLYMDRRATAKFMGVSEKFLANHLTDGPKRLRVGSKIVYRLSDVEAWMRQQEITR